MASGAWLTDLEVQRIHELAAAKLTARQIAERIGRDHRTVRREIAGGRRSPRKRAGHDARLAHVGLDHESRRIERTAAMERAMTPEIIREHFIDALTPAHFSKPRAGAARFFSDLEADLAREGFSTAVLQRAAELLRGSRVGVFPKIPLCLWACRSAAKEEAERAVAGTEPATCAADVVESASQSNVSWVESGTAGADRRDSTDSAPAGRCAA